MTCLSLSKPKKKASGPSFNDFFEGHQLDFFWPFGEEKKDVMQYEAGRPSSSSWPVVAQTAASPTAVTKLRPIFVGPRFQGGDI